MFIHISVCVIYIHIYIYNKYAYVPFFSYVVIFASLDTRHKNRGRENKRISQRENKQETITEEKINRIRKRQNPKPMRKSNIYRGCAQWGGGPWPGENNSRTRPPLSQTPCRAPHGAASGCGKEKARPGHALTPRRDSASSRRGSSRGAHASRPGRGWEVPAWTGGPPCWGRC